MNDVSVSVELTYYSFVSRQGKEVYVRSKIPVPRDLPLTSFPSQRWVKLLHQLLWLGSMAWGLSALELGSSYSHELDTVLNKIVQIDNDQCCNLEYFAMKIAGGYQAYLPIAILS